MMEWLTYCLYCLDSAALCMLNVQQFDLFGQIQTSQTGGRPFSDTPPPHGVFADLSLRSRHISSSQWPKYLVY